MKGGRKRGRNEDGGMTKHKDMKTRDVQSIFCLISEITSLNSCVCV